MARCTITAYCTRIMEEGSSECIKAIIDNVARRAVLVCSRMANRLTFADTAVMAGQAVTGICARMVKFCSKVVGVMAVCAILIIRVSRNMIG